MYNNGYSVKYPRKVLLRKVMTRMGKALLSLMADIKINGKERLPEKGPIILAGNHVAAMEAVLMAVYNPGLVEFIGNGDIPFDPNYALIAKSYGLIPVNRGNLDLKGLQMGLDVLEQNGILCIFPEGGIWDPAKMQAQIGVAWLSYKSKAPVLPIGFAGIKDAINKILKFKHPTLVMNVGEMLPPVQFEDNNLTLKESLQIAANKIMGEINALMPQEDVRRFQNRVDENYELEINVFPLKSEDEIPEAYQVKHGNAYAHFLYNPTMMDVLYRNLNLPIKPIKEVIFKNDLNPLLKAWYAILDYLAVNPGYFTYRFGVDEGLAVRDALEELVQLGQWVQQSGYDLTLYPVHRYRNVNTGAWVIERGGCFPKSM